MKQEGTKVTKTHEDTWYELNDYRQPAAKASARAVSGQIIAAAEPVHQLQLNTDLLERGLRRVLDG